MNLNTLTAHPNLPTLDNRTTCLYISVFAYKGQYSDFVCTSKNHLGAAQNNCKGKSIHENVDAVMRSFKEN